MTDADAIERRLSAVERAVSSGEDEFADLGTATERDRRLGDIEDRLDELEEAVTDLEAATQALRGYVGNVRSVNRDVERRAEAAIAAVDRLENQLDGSAGKRGQSGKPRPSTDRSTRAEREPWGDEGDGLTGDGTGNSTEGETVDATGRGTAIDEVGAGPAMPVPGARRRNGEPKTSGADRPGGSDGTGREDEPRIDADGGGLFDRVRDAL